MKNNEISINAYAKLNLFLDIVGKADNGYHCLDMVMVSVSLFDEITLSISEKTTDKKSQINIVCDTDFGILKEQNIAYKSAEAFFAYAAKNAANTGFLAPQNVLISIKKHIPSSAGMGGGSSDGAAVILALNSLCKTEFSLSSLFEIGVEVGADIPFCIERHLARVRGIGEKILPIKAKLAKLDCYFVIIKPQCEINTKKAYADFDKLDLHFTPPSIEKLIELLEKNDLFNAQNYFYNAFEKLDLPKEIEIAKSFLLKNGSLSPMMTGSGSAVFATFLKKEDAQICYKAALTAGFITYLTNIIE